jgi:recombination protein RecT
MNNNKLAQALGKTPSTQQVPTTIMDLMTQHKQQIALALPKHMSADRMLRIVTTETRKVPDLLKCNPVSLFGAVIQASQLGLEPGGALGHCYLLPFKNTKQNTTDVQLIVGYRGMLDLARRSGQIVSISARAVYANDEFNYEYGLNEQLKHKPCVDEEKGVLIYVYAVAKLKDGGIQFEVMSKADVDGIRKQSKSGSSNYSPWSTHYDDMAKKTVIRRLFKYLPVSIELQTAVGLDEQGDAGLQRNDNVLNYGGDIDITQSIEDKSDKATKTDEVIIADDVIAKAESLYNE